MGIGGMRGGRGSQKGRGGIIVVLSKPPLALTLTDLETLHPQKPNLSQHNGNFRKLT